MIKIEGSILPYLVQFDKYIAGHDGGQRFTDKRGHCWWCDRDDIELIDQPKKKRGIPVGSKNKVKDDHIDALEYSLGQPVVLPVSKEDKIVSLLEQILDEIKGLKEQNND